MTISTKKKVVEEQKTTEAYPDLRVVEAEPEKAKLSDTVKVKVLIGSMHFEQGSFSKGDIFTTTRERALKFPPADIQIIE